MSVQDYVEKKWNLARDFFFTYDNQQAKLVSSSGDPVSVSYAADKVNITTNVYGYSVVSANNNNQATITANIYSLDPLWNQIVDDVNNNPMKDHIIDSGTSTEFIHTDYGHPAKVPDMNASQEAPSRAIQIKCSTLSTKPKVVSNN